jgi:hypothetical protein
MLGLNQWRTRLSHRLFTVYDRELTRIAGNRWHRSDIENRRATTNSDNKREPGRCAGGAGRAGANNRKKKGGPFTIAVWPADLSRNVGVC